MAPVTITQASNNASDYDAAAVHVDASCNSLAVVLTGLLQVLLTGYNRLSVCRLDAGSGVDYGGHQEIGQGWGRGRGGGLGGGRGVRQGGWELG